MSLIRKWNELTVSTKIKTLIYGQPGVGKTTLALSAPKPLILDYDGGIQRVNHHQLEAAGIVQIRSYEDTMTVLDKEDLSPYETIIFDTGGKLLDYMGSYIISKNSKMRRGAGQLTLQGYGERKAIFQALIRKINTELDKHIVFVAHRETKTDGDDTRYVPMFGGSNYDALVTELDLVGYMEAFDRERRITFDPTSRSDGKNTCNLPSVISLPGLIDGKGEKVNENNFLSTVFDNYNNYTLSLREQAMQIKDLQKTVNELLLKVDTIDELEVLIDDIKDWQHVGNSKNIAALLVNDKARALGYRYDKKEKGYIAITELQEAHEG